MRRPVAVLPFALLAALSACSQAPSARSDSAATVAYSPPPPVGPVAATPAAGPVAAGNTAGANVPAAPDMPAQRPAPPQPRMRPDEVLAAFLAAQRSPGAERVKGYLSDNLALDPEEWKGGPPRPMPPLPGAPTLGGAEAPVARPGTASPGMTAGGPSPSLGGSPAPPSASASTSPPRPAPLSERAASKEAFAREYADTVLALRRGATPAPVVWPGEVLAVASGRAPARVYLSAHDSPTSGFWLDFPRDAEAPGEGQRLCFEGTATGLNQYGEPEFAAAAVERLN
ncbi:MAG: hypothetical protein HY719_15430 [Planctomycetes bacterium]|nr:hypothetical protein [Planctomycetota bacterium]